MQQLTIVKIGGKVIDQPEALNDFLDAFAGLPGKIMLVHGGGNMATQLAPQLGIEPQMVEGRRVTDAETLKLVTMVYAGLVNKNLVAALQAKGLDAIGLCGSDLNLIQAKKRQHASIDFGFVGDILKVNSLELSKLVDSNKVVVVAPLTHDGKGQLLNTNADTIATELAIAMSPFYKVKLMYSFEKGGVLLDSENDESVLSILDKERYNLLKSTGIISQGMLPKTHNAFHAVDSGVQEVVIGNLLQMQSGGSMGTQIVEQVQ
jgi:acetylglutamate kinase